MARFQYCNLLMCFKVSPFGLDTELQTLSKILLTKFWIKIQFERIHSSLFPNPYKKSFVSRFMKIDKKSIRLNLIHSASI